MCGFIRQRLKGHSNIFEIKIKNPITDCEAAHSILSHTHTRNRSSSCSGRALDAIKSFKGMGEGAGLSIFMSISSNAASASSRVNVEAVTKMRKFSN